MNKPKKVTPIQGIKSDPKKAKLPPQNGPLDTSNWDNREFNAPNGHVIIEMDQETKKRNRKTISE